jgi:MHS family proline/betaine transporter-like MFS transporter
MSASADAGVTSQRGIVRGIAAASIGNMLEWYDFTVYALFAAYLAHNFFPSNDPSADLVKTFLAFGVGFVIRPVGAVLIGAYGDRAGRKAALTLTILLMALGTLIIAIAPTYRAIGIGAPLLIFTARLLQGFSAGGEIGSAGAFLAESAGSGKVGTVAAWLEASMGMSNILGALVAVAVTSSLSAQQLQGWGWRVPFIVGLAIVPVGLMLRRSLAETPEFEQERLRRRSVVAVPGSPLGQAFQAHWRNLGIGFGLSILWAVAVYVLIIFTPVYVQNAFSFSAPQAFLASLIGNVLFVAGCLASGRLSDRIGRTAVLSISAISLLVLVLPLFLWLQASPTTGVLIIVQSAFCVMVAGFVGTAPAALSELFPTGIRSTGISLAYNGAITLFGGFAPAILTWLTRHAGSAAMAPAWYVMWAAVVALLAMPFFARRHRDILGAGAAQLAA